MSTRERLAEHVARRRAEQERTTCACTRDAGGFTNRGTPEKPWWVHAACGLPTEGWLRAQGSREG